MTLLEKNIIEAAKRELEKLRFTVCDPKATEEFAQPAIDLDMSIEEALFVDRCIRLNQIEALTGLANAEKSGLSGSATIELKDIATQSRALERTAIWTGN